jgi:hypothetical protein
MIKIAVIKKNRCEFPQFDELVPPLLCLPNSDKNFEQLNQTIDDYIWSVLEPHVTFVSVDKDDMMTSICENLTNCFPQIPMDQFYYLTESSYSTPQIYLELIYAMPLWSTYTKNQIENMNNIGCLLSLKHNIVENNCVVIANTYDLKANKYVTLSDITRKDLVQVIRKRYFHSAILLKNNTMTKYLYQNPLSLVSKIFNLNPETDSIQTLSFTYLKYNLVYYFQPKQEDSYPNKCATRINGHNLIYGDVIVLNELDENIYGDLDPEEIRDLNLLSYGRMTDRDLKVEESFDTESNTTEPTDTTKSNEKDSMLWSKYLVVMSRLSALNNQCLCCNNKITKRVICPHCFRARYCSENCLINDYKSIHFKECIYSL